MCLMRINIKIMFIAVMVTNQYVDDQFSKPFKSCLGKTSIHEFINSVLEESNYCSDVMKKHFNKQLA